MKSPLNHHWPVIRWLPDSFVQGQSHWSDCLHSQRLAPWHRGLPFAVVHPIGSRHKISMNIKNRAIEGNIYTWNQFLLRKDMFFFLQQMCTRRFLQPLGCWSLGYHIFVWRIPRSHQGPSASGWNLMMVRRMRRMSRGSCVGSPKRLSRPDDWKTPSEWLILMGGTSQLGLS